MLGKSQSDQAGNMKTKISDVPIDQIIRTKRKTIGLQITPEGKLIVRAPLRADDATIMQVISRHRKWIERTRHKIQIQRKQSPPKKFVPGEKFLFMGESFPLKIVENGSYPLTLKDAFYLSRRFLPYAATVFQRWYRIQAGKIIFRRVQYFAFRYQFEFREAKISNARTRWGSCSSRGNLNFTWRLIMAPLPVIDYVVVHELVHLEIKNHSRQFWNRVEEIMPDYRRHKKWLKENGHRLQI